jgi:hypothetical protein
LHLAEKIFWVIVKVDAKAAPRLRQGKAGDGKRKLA